MKQKITSLHLFILEFMKTLGFEQSFTSHSEKYIAVIGIFLSMAGCYLITESSLSVASTHLFVASMAASSVLLFALPHGAVSQPWPLVAGHLSAAVLGVTCYQVLGNTLISASIATSVSVLIMYYCRCLHPPAAATAFLAVTSGNDVHALGYDFVWLVIAANITCLLAIAVTYNGLFHWRRYPAHVFKTPEIQPSYLVNNENIDRNHQIQNNIGLTLEDITAALEQENSFIDATSEYLLHIFEQALLHSLRPSQEIKSENDEEIEQRVALSLSQT